jgi:hypothetical protein
VDAVRVQRVDSQVRFIERQVVAPKCELPHAEVVDALPLELCVDSLTIRDPFFQALLKLEAMPAVEGAGPVDCNAKIPEG